MLGRAHHRLGGPNISYGVTCFRRSVGVLMQYNVNWNKLMGVSVTKSTTRMAQSEATRKKENGGIEVSGCRAQNISPRPKARIPRTY